VGSELPCFLHVATILSVILYHYNNIYCLQFFPHIFITFFISKQKCHSTIHNVHQDTSTLLAKVINTRLINYFPCISLKKMKVTHLNSTHTHDFFTPYLPWLLQGGHISYNKNSNSTLKMRHVTPFQFRT
jgi:hypothetical protein